MTLPVDIANTRISIIGAARSGVAAARLLAGKGSKVFVSDAETRESVPFALELERLGVECEFGGHTDRVFEGNYIVISPGVPSEAAVVVEAARRAIPVISEIELAASFCAAPIIAVTGTNGKTTTTTLIGEIMKTAGKQTVVAGNIGHPFSDVAADPACEVAVLEVSSYQLDHCVEFHPVIAVLTTITPDHLSRYGGSFEKYIASKQRIFMNQSPSDALVYNADNDATANAVAFAKSRLFPVSVRRSLNEGAWIEGTKMLLNAGDGIEVVGDVSAMLLRGAHNHMNALMSALAARLFHIPVEAIRETLAVFPGVEHRLELVREFDGVTWINDSKATNVDSVVIALESMSQPVVLIAGGRDKEAPYEPLFDLLKEKVRVVILLGEAADRMEEAFGGIARTYRVTSMDEAVQQAQRVARAGDVVLLSPACASFDMFQDFEHRGRVFKELVMNLNPAESRP